MRLRGIRQIRHLAQQAAKRLAPGIRVLLYHRVVDLPFDPQWLAVRPDQFEEQMQVVRKKYHPLSVRQLVKALANKKIPRNAVVVTFDDGYADNFANAKSILEKLEIPAVVFVTSGSIGAKTEFWWDELERMLFAPASLPETLAMDIAGERFFWKLSKKGPLQTLPDGWDVFQNEIPSERHRLYVELSRRVKELIPEQREEVLAAVAKWVGDDRKARKTHLTMTVDEMRKLAAGGLVEIGAHTMRHPKLSRQSVADQSTEIRGSKRDLEEMLGKPVDTFSFPFGGEDDYTKETTTLLKEAGFRCAFSAMPHCVRRDSKLFELPRFFVRDWNGDQFAKEMSGFASC